MDWKASSTTCRRESEVRNPRTPDIAATSNHIEPMKIAQNKENGVGSSFSNSDDCDTFMGPGLHSVQCVRMMSREFLRIPPTVNGYEFYCPEPHTCLTPKGSKIIIIQDDSEMVPMSSICDTDTTDLKPKYTMKSHVLNPEAKEFIPVKKTIGIQTDSEPQSMDTYDQFCDICNDAMDYISARDRLFPSSNVVSENTKIESPNCSTIPPEEALIMDSSNSSKESKRMCPVSPNLSGNEQTLANGFTAGDSHLHIPSTQKYSSSCLSFISSQSHKNSFQIMSSCIVVDNESRVPVHIPSQSEVSHQANSMDSKLSNGKPLDTLCGVNDTVNCVKASLFSENNGSDDCKCTEDPNSISDNIKDFRNHIKKINKESKDQNLDCTDDDIVFIDSDEDSDNVDWEDEDESSDSEKDESSEEEEEDSSSDETDDEENISCDYDDNCNNESDDDDVSICFTTTNGTQETDDKSDDDGDYACDLFQVEFTENEISIPMSGLFLSDLISQCSRTSTSDNKSFDLDSSSELDDSFSYDDVDCSGFLPEREEVVEANRRWNEAIDAADWCCSNTPTKVKFCDDIQIRLTDDYCRKGPWETCARDRIRFQRRIEETESILNEILRPEHRCKVLNRLQSMEKN